LIQLSRSAADHRNVSQKPEYFLLQRRDVKCLVVFATIDEEEFLVARNVEADLFADDGSWMGNSSSAVTLYKTSKETPKLQALKSLVEWMNNEISDFQESPARTSRRDEFSLQTLSALAYIRRLLRHWLLKCHLNGTTTASPLQTKEPKMMEEIESVLCDFEANRSWSFLPENAPSKRVVASPDGE
jgi:hypothetical protein